MGDGMIVRRGYRRPPSFHHDRLRARPRRATSSTSSPTASARCPTTPRRSPSTDRWAIVAYVRALQLSQHAHARRRAGRRTRRGSTPPRQRSTTSEQATDLMHDATYTPPASLDSLRQRSLLVGVAGLAAAALGAFLNPGQFFHVVPAGVPVLARPRPSAASRSRCSTTCRAAAGASCCAASSRRPRARCRGWRSSSCRSPSACRTSTRGPTPRWSRATTSCRARPRYLNTPFFLVRAAVYFAIWMRPGVRAARRGRASRTGPATPRSACACSASSAGGLVSTSSR